APVFRQCNLSDLSNLPDNSGNSMAPGLPRLQHLQQQQQPFSGVGLDWRVDPVDGRVRTYMEAVTMYAGE
ncbi:MAG: hypothetical protein ACKPKO_18505, partial [Candidatus Fonsibacter sp.]